MKRKGLALLCVVTLLFALLPSYAPVAKAATHADQLQVGYGMKNVTPQESVPIAGYGNTLRRMSEYNASDITKSHLLDDNGDGKVDSNDGSYAVCIAVMDSDGEIMLFYGMDLIGANNTVIADARKEIIATLEKQGHTLNTGNIMVNVSHSHSSPDLSQTKAVAHYVSTVLIPGMVQAAEAAVADLKPVTDISKVTVKTTNMNFVRHYAYFKDATYTGEPVGYAGDNYSTGNTSSNFVKPVSEADPNIYMLKFEREDGLPVVIANWTAHPKCNSTGDTAWGRINRRKVSSDYVGTFRQDLKNAGYLVAFYQGAAGNINTFSKLKLWSHNALSDPTAPETMTYVSGTSKHENGGGKVSGTCQTGVLYGRALADYALEGLEATSNSANVTLESLSGGKIETQQRMYSAAIDHSDQEAYEALMEPYSETQTYFDYISANWSSTIALTYREKYDINSTYHLSAIKRRGEATSSAYDLELNAIRIGEDISFVTAPNELFDTYCTDLRARGTFVFGYSNQSMGYLPDRMGIEVLKCYEANTTNHVVGTGEGVAQTLMDMLMTPEEIGLESTCSMCGAKNVQWQVLGGTNNTGAYSEARDITAVTSGHYYMIHDMMGYGSTWQKSFYGNVCLDMRGHTVEATSAVTGRALLLTDGSNVHIRNGTWIGQGVSVEKNANGGVVFLYENATLTAQNVKFQRVQKDNQIAACGGVIYLSEASKLNLTDCVVTGGVATQQGGGIYTPASAEISVDGSTVITGNTLADGTTNNLYLEKPDVTGDNFRLLGGYCGALGVSLPAGEGNPVFGTCPDSYTSGGFISMDAGGYGCTSAGKLTVSNACPYCGEADVTWKEFPASGSGEILDIPAGHYYLADDRGGAKANYRRQIKGDVCLNMNGHLFANESVTTGTAFYVTSGNTFRVFGTGTIQGQGYKTANNGVDKLYQGGAIRVDEGAAAYLYGITVQRGVNLDQSTKWGGVIYAGGDVTLSGAKVVGGTATIHGDGIYVAQTGSLTLLGNTQVEKNIYLAGSGEDALHVADSYTGLVTLELPAYIDESVIGTGGQYAGNIDLDAEKTLCLPLNGKLVVKVLEDLCRIVSANGVQSAAYDTLEEALAVYAYSANSPSYIRLLDDVCYTVDVDETVYLDTNGHDIAVRVMDAGAVYGMENRTDDYAIGDEELGTITFMNGKSAPETDITLGGERHRYLAMEENGAYTYHRFSLQTRKGLQPYSNQYGTCLYFQPTFRADEAISAVADYGVIVSPQENGKEPIQVSFKDGGLIFDEAVKNGEYRVIVPELMPKNTELEAGTKTLENHDLSQMQISGQAYLSLPVEAGEAYVVRDDNWDSISILDALLIIDGKDVYSTLSASHKSGLSAMLEAYSQVIHTWGESIFSNIGK